MEHLLIHAGYGALALFGFLEACCVPIPSELTFLFGGVLAFQGHLNVVLVIVIAPWLSCAARSSPTAWGASEGAAWWSGSASTC